MNELTPLRGAPLPLAVNASDTLPITRPAEPGPMALRGAPLGAAQAPAPSHDPVRRAAEEFESMFLAQMMEPMFEGLSTDGLGGGGMGEEMFRPMLIQQYAQALSSNGGIGLADNLVRELNRLQAAQAPPQETQDGAHR